MNNPPQLQPADLVFTNGDGWLSRSIRFFTRSNGEPASEANHVAGVVMSISIVKSLSPMVAINDAHIVEALSSGVVKRSLAAAYGGTKTKVLIARPINITEFDRLAITAGALEYVGRKYGWGKIFTTLGDWCLGAVTQLFGRPDPYVFRRLNKIDGLPVCHWIWVRLFRQRGLTFGMTESQATPDSMLDFVRANPDKYEIVMEWQTLPATA